MFGGSCCLFGASCSHSSPRRHNAGGKHAFWGIRGSRRWQPENLPRGYRTSTGIFIFRNFGDSCLFAACCCCCCCCCLLARHASPPHCSNSWINQQKYHVLQLGDPGLLHLRDLTMTLSSLVGSVVFVLDKCKLAYTRL